MSNDSSTYHHTVSVLYMLKRLGMRQDILEEAKAHATTRFMFSAVMGNPHHGYPVAPPRSTWPDKVIVGVSIILAVAMGIMFIAGVWKCSLLLYACL